jgi:hypothetical protein
MMGRQRGFLPPPVCEECGKAPDLGESLWPGNKWRCSACLEDSLPGKDRISKSMNQMLEYGQEMRAALDLESQGSQAEEPRNRAQWARIVAGEMTRQWDARSKEVTQANGEAVPPTTDKFIYDTLTVPDLASVEASFERTQLLLQQGPGVAAMGVDASTSIQSRNSLERMLAHQLAAVHRVAMDHMAFVPSRFDVVGQAKRLNAAARCMTVYQQGLLTLRKLRQDGHQRISVQYVNVSEGSQAVIGNVERGTK